MDEDVDDDLVIDENISKAEPKSPQKKILQPDIESEQIKSSSNIVENDILTKKKNQVDQIQLKASSNDSTGKSNR